MQKILYPIIFAIGLLFVYGIMNTIQQQRMVSFEIGGPDGIDSNELSGRIDSDELSGRIDSNELSGRIEAFSQSTKQEQREGASKYYKWLGGANDRSSSSRAARTHRQKTECPECKHGFDILIQLPDSITKPSGCENADITKNKDIDKYVLKSSVPPCPDMTDYVRKSELPPHEAHDLRHRVAAHTKGKREQHHHVNRAEDKPNTALPPSDQYYEPTMATSQGHGHAYGHSHGQGHDHAYGHSHSQDHGPAYGHSHGQDHTHTYEPSPGIGSKDQQQFVPDFQENDYGGYAPYNAMIPSMS